MNIKIFSRVSKLILMMVVIFVTAFFIVGKTFAADSAQLDDSSAQTATWYLNQDLHYLTGDFKGLSVYLSGSNNYSGFSFGLWECDSEPWANHCAAPVVWQKVNGGLGPTSDKKLYTATLDHPYTLNPLKYYYVVIYTETTNIPYTSYGSKSGDQNCWIASTVNWGEYYPCPNIANLYYSLDIDSAPQPVASSSQLLKVDNNTISLWRFNDTSGQIVTDETGKNNGTAIGTTVVDGKFGEARYFNGISDYITVPNSSSLNNLSQYTVEAWVNPSGFNLGCSNSLESLVSKGANDNYRNEIYFNIIRNSDNLCGGANSFNQFKFNIGGVESPWYSPNQWYYVVLVYRTDNASLYVNGNLAGEWLNPGLIVNNSDPLYFNHHTWGSGQSDQRMAGLIDEIRISNVARSAEEIKNYYNLANDINPAPIISSLQQFKADGVTAIGDGSSTPQNAVVLGATVNSSSTNQLQLQVQLSTSTTFDNPLTASSSFVSSGLFATISFPNLADGQYYWRARAIDDQGQVSDWQEFGVAGAGDFKIVPLDIKNAPPFQPTFSPICPNITLSTKNLVFITHGFNGSGNDPWVQQMASSIQSRLLDNSWSVCNYDWGVDASMADLSSDSIRTPWEAYANAGVLGKRVGKSLAQLNLNSIHFIAHSAGAELIQSAASWIRQNADVKPIMQLTFLDAYDPLGSGSFYGLNPNPSVSSDWWAEQYVDMHGDLVPSYNNTNIILNNAYNFDVTPMDPYSGLDLTNYHAWPYMWYQTSATLGNYGYGFPLSLESGKTKLPLNFKPSGYCVLNSNINLTCDPNMKQYSIVSKMLTGTLDFVKDSINGLFEISISGAVHLFSDLNAVTLETGSPVWIQDSITTTQKSNVISFNYQFLSAAGAQGILTLFVDDNPVYKIDERVVPAALNSEQNVPIGDLNPGLHKIGFRLDPFTDVHSIVQISNVQFGYLDIQHLTDNMAPTIFIDSPTSKEYLHSQLLPIDVTATDTESGVASFEIKLDGTVTTSTAVDLFYQKLGIHMISASSTDNVGNSMTTLTSFRVTADLGSTISNVNRAYSLGWIPKKDVKNELNNRLNAVIKINKRIDVMQEKMPDGRFVQHKVERMEEKIDKILGRILIKDIDKWYNQGKINQQGYDLIKGDIQWLIDNDNSV